MTQQLKAFEAVCINSDLWLLQTSNALYKTLGILFEAVRCSWRNSEDMERLHGYEILAYLLKQKRDIIDINHLEMLLNFIGKDTAYPR